MGARRSTLCSLVVWLREQRRRSSLDEYRLSIADGNGHIDALSTTLAAFGRHARYASEQTTELKDADTADIFQEVARGIDTWLWFVETSQQSGS